MKILNKINKYKKFGNLNIFENICTFYLSEDNKYIIKYKFDDNTKSSFYNVCRIQGKTKEEVNSLFGLTEKLEYNPINDHPLSPDNHVIAYMVFLETIERLNRKSIIYGENYYYGYI